MALPQLCLLQPHASAAVLAAQFHALHLGAGRGGSGGGLLPPAGAFHLPGRTPSPSVSSHGGSNGSPHQHLDPSLLGGDLLARLQMGAAAAGGAPPVMLGRLPNHHLAHAGSAAAGLPPGGPAAGAAVQHAPQLQQRQQIGRRRSGGSGGGGGGGGGGGRRNEEKVRRTVYISDISDTVSEAQLAGFFQECGQLVDCRVCGDPNSSMRFAFIEFLSEDAAQQVGAARYCWAALQWYWLLCGKALQGLLVGQQAAARLKRA